MLSVFVSGLKKCSGKTFVAGGLSGVMQSLSYSVSFYKPIQTGAQVLNNFPTCNDILKVKEIDSNITTCNTYSFKNSSSPVFGAFDVGIKRIELSKIIDDYKKLSMNSECIILEGSNSISSPLNENSTEINIPKCLNVPVLLVVNSRTTTIDEIISGISYIYSNKVPLCGVILNEVNSQTENSEQKYLKNLVKEYTGAKILGNIPYYDNFNNITAGTWIEETLKYLDIEGIFGLKISKLS